jgi:hypothetical protein
MKHIGHAGTKDSQPQAACILRLSTLASLWSCCTCSALCPLLLQCWAAAPADRPTADQLVEAVESLIAAREGQGTPVGDLLYSLQDKRTSYARGAAWVLPGWSPHEGQGTP